MKIILLVDDDIQLCAVYEEILRRAGYFVIVRQHGRSALAVIQKGQTVHLVITDCEMPGMDGFEFIANLKQLDPSVPILMMSADVSTEKYARALELGAIECVEKPKQAMDLQRFATAAFMRPGDEGWTLHR